MDLRLPEMTPGAVVAVLEERRCAEVMAVGTRCHLDEPMSATTVFEAASLSKPVFARLVLGLVDQGIADLDAPFLTELDMAELSIDRDVSSITPAMVLTHTTGLPNWRTGSTLGFEAAPGTPGYSGEVVELLLASLARRIDINAELERLLHEVAMPESSFVWNASLEGRVATGHLAGGESVGAIRPEAPLASGSLLTTAADYAHFVEATIRPKPTKEPPWHNLVVAPREEVSSFHTAMWAHSSTPSGPVLWQHGDNPGFKHLVAVRPDVGDGFVVLTNGDTGWELVRTLADSLDLTLW